jgi:hypothetical protein
VQYCRGECGCAATCCGQRDGCKASPDANQPSSRTGGWCSPKTGWWEPDEPRGSRPVLREPGVRFPLATRPSPHLCCPHSAKITHVSSVIRAACSAVIFDHPYNGPCAASHLRVSTLPVSGLGRERKASGVASIDVVFDLRLVVRGIVNSDGHSVIYECVCSGSGWIAARIRCRWPGLTRA